MNFKKMLLSAAIATMLVSVGANASDAQTQNPDRVVYFTFTQAVTIPGSTLPPGRYRFQILQNFTDRGILRIQNGDGSKTFSTLLTVPTSRTDVVAAPELRFLETAASAPPAIGSYWMPATGIGWEFVYPKDQATTLAINTKNPVLAGPAPGNVAQQTSVNGLARVTPAGESAAYVPNSAPRPVSGGVLRGSMDESDSSVADAVATPAPTMASNTAPANARTVGVNDGASTPARPAARAQNSANSMRDSETARSNRTALPATASSTPLAGLAGLVALAGAFGLAVWRRRMA